MDKKISMEAAASMIQDGMSLMIGGFYGVGAPEGLIGELVRQGKRDLTLITCEGGWDDRSVGRLVANGCVRRLIVSWVGNLRCVTELALRGALELELNPQGTLIERIRAGGCGLGGVLVKTGLGTAIETDGIGKRITLNGEDWLYHTPLRADFGLMGAWGADEFGNLRFDGTENNYNFDLCMACDTVIAEIGGVIVPVGAADRNVYKVSGIFVDYLVGKVL